MQPGMVWPGRVTPRWPGQQVTGQRPASGSGDALARSGIQPRAYRVLRSPTAAASKSTRAQAGGHGPLAIALALIAGARPVVGRWRRSCGSDHGAEWGARN